MSYLHLHISIRIFKVFEAVSDTSEYVPIYFSRQQYLFHLFEITLQRKPNLLKAIASMH